MTKHIRMKTTTNVFNEPDGNTYDIESDIYLTSFEAAAKIIKILSEDTGLDEVHIDSFEDLDFLYEDDD